MMPSEFDKLRQERPDLFDEDFIVDQSYRKGREFLETVTREEAIVGATVYLMRVGLKAYHLSHVRRSLENCI